MIIRKWTLFICLLASALLLTGSELDAAVKTEEKSQVKFEGMLGKMMGLFGGKAMKEGTVTTVAVKGNRKSTVSEYGGEIVDLDEEKVYTLDTRKKTYEVVTFAEMRRRMQEAREKAEKSAREQGENQPPKGEKQMEIDFSVKESGQKRNINGFDCREVVATITAREKGKTLEQAGGTVMTSNLWLTPTIPALKEAEEFAIRYAQKLGEMAGLPSAEQMATALAMYPAMTDVMKKMQAEKVNMEGTPILTVMTMEAVKSAEQMSQQQKQEDSSDGSPARGIGGLLGRKIFKKKDEGAQTGNRATIMTVNQEVLKVTPDVAPGDLAIPAGYKEKK